MECKPSRRAGRARIGGAYSPKVRRLLGRRAAPVRRFWTRRAAPHSERLSPRETKPRQEPFAIWKIREKEKLAILTTGLNPVRFTPN